MIRPPEDRWSYLSGKTLARQVQAQVAASAVTIKTYCTIVDMMVEKEGVLKPDPSGWDDGNVQATLASANAILQANRTYVKFEKEGPVKRIELNGFLKDGRVDTQTYFLMAKTVGASGFTRREVRVAFIKNFSSSMLMGQSAQSMCFVCVRRPIMTQGNELTTGLGVGYGAQTLAHEFGHILGLPHAKAQDSLMFRAVFYGADTRMSTEERTIILTHPHTDNLAIYRPPENGEVLSHP